MAITGNIAGSKGDSFIIEVEAPVIGLISLATVIDSVTGNFFKEFQYSVDGINFTDWKELTDDNLAEVSVTSKDVFLIRYRYTNLDSTSSTFDSVQVSGSFEEISCGKTYRQSIFADFFSCLDNDVLQWCINVTVKLYKQGIVPFYIKRGDESNLNGIDRDYIDFWRTVACFFAYMVNFVRNFKNFRSNDLLLDIFLENRGIYFCDSQSFADKDFLVENYFDQVRQRGSSLIYKSKEQTGRVVNGELLRLICYGINDEFIFNLHLPHTIGWSVNNSSPLFGSCENQPGTNKAYESTQDFLDLDSYPTFGNGTQSIFTDGSKEVYRILNVPDTEIAGIGDNDADFQINVNPNIDYEITFWVRQPVAEANLTFGLRSYTLSGLSTLLKVDDNSTENNFFETIQLANTTDYFFVRGILYNQNANSGITGTGTIASSGTTVTGNGTLFTTELNVGDYIEADNQKIKVVSIDSNTSLEVESAFSPVLLADTYQYYNDQSVDPDCCFSDGVNLKMRATTAKIIPYIVLDNTSGGDADNELRIWDLKIRPRTTPYSTGFVNPKNFISIWLEQNNAGLSRDQLESKFRRFLLPYDSTFKVNYLNEDFTITS